MRKYFVSIVLIFCLLMGSSYGQIEHAERIIATTMEAPPLSLLYWNYFPGFYYWGQYRIYKRTGNYEYFTQMRDYLYVHVQSDGVIAGFHGTLDHTQPGVILLLCYEKTGDEKYKLAADIFRDNFNTYPRNSDGAFWHNKEGAGELWIDGLYMALPFLALYGKMFNEPALYDEVVNQFLLYTSHTQHSSGLLYHGYDEDGSSDWADPVTLHSPHFWGRSMGWVGMALVEVLDIIPQGHTGRPALIALLAQLAQGIVQHQDSATGMWYQIIDRGDDPDNWLETSCSCMYSYFLARAAMRGYISYQYVDNAVKAYNGIISHRYSVDGNGRAQLTDICVGTKVKADYSYYINRPRETNDPHGLAAFLMMCWQIDQIPTDNFNITLHPDWNLISFNVEPSDNSISALISGLGGRVSRISGYSAVDGFKTWDADRPSALNDLVSMSGSQGFWMKLTEGTQLTWSIGGSTVLVNTPIPLGVNWNLLSYLPSQADVIDHALSSLGSSYSLVSGFQGGSGGGFKTWDRQRPAYLNDLQYLEPGSGYWIRMTEAKDLVYPATGYQTGKIIPDAAGIMPLAPGDAGTPTNEICDFWSVDTEGLRVGEIVTVEDSGGRICGKGHVVPEGGFLIHVSGDDLSTEQWEGPVDGEVLVIKCGDRVLSTELPLRWQSMESLKVVILRDFQNKKIPDDFVLSQNFPNPFNPRTTFHISLSSRARISLKIFNVHGMLIKVLMDDTFTSGTQFVSWDGCDRYGENVASSIYLAVLESPAGRKVRKISVLR